MSYDGNHVPADRRARPTGELRERLNPAGIRQHECIDVRDLAARRPAFYKRSTNQPNKENAMDNRAAKRLIAVGIVVSLAAAASPAAAQTPFIFDVSDVVVGAQKIETRYFLASGKWSNAGSDVGPASTEIHCYQRLAFCEVADANSALGHASVTLSSLDVLKWDDKELIAVDSSPICIVVTLRADFVTKRVTMSSADKGVTNDPFCKGFDKLPTVFLLGPDVSAKRPAQSKPR